MWVKPLKGLLFWIKWPVRIQTFVAGGTVGAHGDPILGRQGIRLTDIGPSRAHPVLLRSRKVCAGWERIALNTLS
jgi:hypothetical protein